MQEETAMERTHVVIIINMAVRYDMLKEQHVMGKAQKDATVNRRK